MKCRRLGFALVVTLWTLVAASAAVTLASLGTRDALAGSRNRAALTVAEWESYGCVERALFRLDLAVWPDGATQEHVASAWRRLDALRPALQGHGCVVELTPAGMTVNVNTVAADRLHALLIESGVPAATADSLVDALLDWRDADDDARPHGAERAWYAANARAVPRNGALQHADELTFVRGFARDAPFLRYLGVEPERIVWRRAPRAVLAALPGMSPEALDVLRDRRAQVSALTALADFPELGRAARARFVQYTPPLALAIADAPEAWTLSAGATTGFPPVVTTLTVRLVLAERHLLAVRRTLTP